MALLRVILAVADTARREFILDMLREASGIEVVGLTDDGRRVLAMTERLRPDLVLMGLSLRTMNGLHAAQEIMIESPTPILLVSGDPTEKDVDLALQAIRSGALSVLELPEQDDPNLPRKQSEFISTIKALSEVKLVRRWRVRSTTPNPAAPADQSKHAPAKIVAIAGSTGGPAALETILLGLPSDFPAPILIVQHIAAGFLEGVAAWLNQVTSFNVKVGRQNEPLKPGVAYFAPDDFHLGASSAGRIQLSDAPPIGGFRPSANHLFDSVGRAFGRNALAVILTGMGRDGVTGLRSVHAEGGRIFAQDEASSIVFGMPKAAIDEGIVDRVLPSGEIGRALQEAVSSQ